MFRFVLAAVFICCAGSAHAQLAGSYSIGPGGDYLSISDAVADLNANGVSDEVSFKLTAGAFDEQVTINSFTRFGPADIPVTFQGTGTTVWEFSGQSSAANWVVRLLGADHVTFEGITFEAAGTSPNGRLIVFQSVSSSNGATNNTVKDCTLLGFLGLNSDASSLVYEAASNRGNDDNRFQDNTFTYGYAGVDFRGAATPTGSQGIEVIGNTFEAQTRAGVWIDGQNAEVDNNTLTNAIWATSSFRGLELPNAAGSEVTDNVVDLADGAIGIYVRGSVDPVTVANNMVSGHAGTVTAGIDVSGGSIDVVFNSVLIQSAGTSAAPIRTGSTMGAIRNNIFAHANNGFAAVYAHTGGLVADYTHNTYDTGSVFDIQYLGTSYQLSGYQSLTGRDAQSNTVAVTFTNLSSTPRDLHLAGASDGDFSLAGTAIAGITRDIDGQFRDGSNPYRGADEATPLTPLDNDDTTFGYYTVGGVSPDFTDVEDAVAALNGLGLKGEVTFRIRAGTYLTNATLDFPRFDGAATNEVLFRASNLNNRPTLQHNAANQNDNWVFQLDGVEYVAFETINFQATGSAAFDRILVMVGGTSDVRVDDCTFTGSIGGTNDEGTLLVAESMAGVASGDNLDVTNSTFTNGWGGALVEGQADPVTFTGNTFSAQTRYALDVFAGNLAVNENEVSNAAWATSNYVGFDLNVGTSGQLIRNDIDLVDGSTGVEWRGPGLIANNLISVRSSVGVRGIYVAQVNAVDVVFNTVRMASSSGSRAFESASPGTGGATLKSNILVNAGGGLALDLASPASTALASDFNVLYTTGGTLAEVNNAGYATLAAYQAAVSQQDQNSASTAVTFVSTVPANLRLAGASNGDVLLLGTPIPGVNQDFDGDARETYNPYAGADEPSIPLPPLDDADAGGAYTVGGSSPDFAGPEEAITHLNRRGLKGDVTFDVRLGTYTVHATLSGIPRYEGATANPIRIQGPATGTRPTFQHAATSSANNWVVQVDNEDYIEFDRIRFNATGTGVFGTLLRATGDADDLTVTDCDFDGLAGQASVSSAVIYSASTDLDRTTLTDNTISNGSYGMYLWDGDNSDGAPASSDLIAEGNTFVGQTISFVVFDHNEAAVTGNSMFSTANSLAAGIWIHTPALDFEVTKNMVRIDASTSALGCGIQVEGTNYSAVGGPGDPLIANNFFKAKRGICIEDDNLGLEVEALKIYNNSVFATGTGLRIEDGVAGVDILNNLLVMQAENRALDVEFASGITRIDYTAFSRPNANFGQPIEWEGVDYSLLEFQINIGKALNSTDTDVTYANTATGDLHLAGSSIGDPLLSALPVPEVTDDIDGETRQPAPYMGADERPNDPLIVTLDLTVLLAGPFTGSGVMSTALNSLGLIPLSSPATCANPVTLPAGFFDTRPDIVDWVCLQLRTGDPLNPPMTIVTEVPALLTSAGKAVSPSDGSTLVSMAASNGTYFVVVQHRNHLAVMQQITVAGGAGTHDFASLDAYVVGPGLAQRQYPGSGALAMWSGDAFSSGVVTNADLVDAWVLGNGKGLLYLTADFDLSGFVDALDAVEEWVPAQGKESFVPD